MYSNVCPLTRNSSVAMVGLRSSDGKTGKGVGSPAHQSTIIDVYSNAQVQ